MNRLNAILSRPVNIQSLVAIRVLFGAILLWDWWRYIRHDRIYRYYVEPDLWFPFSRPTGRSACCAARWHCSSRCRRSVGPSGTGMAGRGQEGGR